MHYFIALIATFMLALLHSELPLPVLLSLAAVLILYIGIKVIFVKEDD